MSKPLIEVGISVIHGHAAGALSEEQAKGLVSHSLRLIDTDELPVRCALLLATADWCTASPSVPARVYEQLKAHLGYEVPLLGGSMAGFYCSTETEPEVPHGVVLLLMCSKHLWVSVRHLAEPYSGTRQQRKQRLVAMAAELLEEAGVRLGASADKSLFGILPGIVTDERGEKVYLDNELYDEVLEAFNYMYPLVGASAADKIEPQVGYQFSNDLCLKSGLVVASVESDLGTAAMMTHGFEPLPHARVSVDALAGGEPSGYEVARLDGKPAAERLQELTRDGMSRLERPVFGLPCGKDFNVIWPQQVHPGKDGIVRVKRKVALGDRLYVLNADPEHMLRAGAKALRGVIRRAGVDVSNLSLILGFSCVGRIQYYAAYNADWRAAISHLRESYMGVPLVWALSAGEFGIDEWRRNRANNMSISTICVANVHSRRAATRNFQNKLLEAGSQLITCATPRSVMETALAGAVEAGATGGQVCIVDGKLGRIIGKEHGYSLSPIGSPQDWPAVAKMTDRVISHREGGALPVYLEPWAMPVVSEADVHHARANHRPRHHEGEREDILPLIVRTLHAVYILDSRDPKFHCNHEAVERGNLGCQLAVPLVGSSGRAIATLQVSFAESKPIDRESLALWVGYAQKIAIALDRAQEVEEREILGSISRHAGDIMQESVDPDVSSPTDWCEKYLSLVVNLLGADGGHFRALKPDLTSETRDEHKLIAAVGHLADLLPFTRPVIRRGDGSFRPMILNSRGKGFIANTKEDSAFIISDVEAITNGEQYGTALKRELGKVESLAIIPLYEQGFVIGSLDVYSKRKYFFTERRCNVVRAAARLAGSILRAKTAEYFQVCAEEDRRLLDEERRRMLDDITHTTDGGAERRLRSLLAQVYEKLKADVASVYIWYDAPKRLILYAGYNWHQDMEKRASYSEGEGWVGSAAFGKDDICIVLPTSNAARQCRQKYYEKMVAPEHRVATDEVESRIGIRLVVGEDVVGFVSFSYHRENSKYAMQLYRRTAEYLREVRHLITLDVEAVKKEIRQNQMRRLAELKEKIAQSPAEDVNLGQEWQHKIDVIREGFQVERVTFYEVHPDKTYNLVWSSSAKKELETLGPNEPAEPVEAMADVIRRQDELLITSSKDPRLERWPNGHGVKSLFAIPVKTNKGVVCGVLEYVNRIPMHEHPFDTFDAVEMQLAKDMAVRIAAAIEQREHDRTLLELRSRIQTATKIGATGLYSAIVMHQIMGPFSLMRAAIDCLKADHTEEERRRYLARIEASFSQALESVKRAAHQWTPGLQRVSLRTVVRQALRAIETEIPLSGIERRWNIDLNVPLHVDLYSVVGALVNVLSNALDALKGSGVLTVSTELAADRRHAVIRIHNTGPVLKREEVAWLFQPGASTKTSIEGHHLGLGLPLAKRAIEDARGTIEMNSPPKGGVEVTITLPVAGDYKPGPAAMQEEIHETV